MSDIKRILGRIRDGRLKELAGEWLWMYAYVRRYWWLIAIYTALGSFGSLLGLGTSMVSRDLVDAVTGTSGGAILEAAALYVGVGVSQIFINLVKGRISLKIRLKITNEIREDIYSQILHTDWESLAGYRTGDFLYRVNGDAGIVSGNILNFIPNLVSICISFGGAFLVMMQNDPWMALIALAGAPATFFSSRKTTKKMREYQSQNQDVATDKMSFDQETFQNLQIIKAFGLVETFTKKLHTIQQESMNMALAQNKFQAGTMVLNSLIGQLVGYLCYGFAIYRLWQGDITYGTMTMFVSMASSLRGSFNAIIGLIPTMVRVGTSAGRIMEMVNLPREEAESSEEAEAMREEARERGVEVRMDYVTFQYEENRPIYQEADFEARPGEIVVLIGPSGQGKTTTLRLFLGLFHPAKGSITVSNPGGKTLKTSASTRCLFSYVPQGNTMFTGTIAENMRLIRPEASDEEICQALETACAWEFVKKLPNGIHTQMKERGQRFSEGQNQRLSIARAILADAPVILLDEATSALDIQMENRLLKQIMKNDPCRTVIVATHRPSVFSMCDRIYRVENGYMKELPKEEVQLLSQGEQQIGKERNLA